MDKVKTLKRYKFSLAFENSNEEDYVTEKFFQSLVAGKYITFLLTPCFVDEQSESELILRYLLTGTYISIVMCIRACIYGYVLHCICNLYNYMPV